MLNYYSNKTKQCLIYCVQVNMSWLVIGISGVTCGGKTTLASTLFQYLSDPNNTNTLDGHTRIQTVKMINQDQYFLPEDDPRHTRIERVNHNNWEILKAMDIPRMCNDLRAIIGDLGALYAKPHHASSPPLPHVNILIIEGFLIFNVPLVLELCHLKFHLHVPYEKCFARRSQRVYDPPDKVGYFEMCVWPMYVKNFNEFRDVEDLHVMNGELPTEKVLSFVLDQLARCFAT